MKIHDHNMTGISGAGLGKTDAVQSSGGRKTQSAGGGQRDQVQISDLAQAIGSLSSDSPERSERLQQLQMEVSSGRYQVDARELSRNIIDETLAGPSGKA